VGREIDLTEATVGVAYVYQGKTATNTTIVWSLVDAGGTGVADAGLADGKFTPANTGTLKLLATIAQGKSLTEDFTKEFTFVITFTPVSGITNTPVSGKPGDVINLNTVIIEPAGRSSTSPIVWTVESAGTTGVSNENLASGSFTPSAAGSLQLRATIANGGASWGTDYTTTITIPIEADSVVLLYTKTGETDTAVDIALETLDEAFTYITDNAAAGDKYVIVLKANQNMTPYASPAGTGKANIEITLRGHGEERIITWNGTSPASLFTLNNNAALILDNRITIDGRNTRIPVTTPATEYTDGHAMISLYAGHLRMKAGSKITGVAGTKGAVTTATSASATGSIVLEGGELSGNSIRRPYNANFFMYGSVVNVLGAGFTFSMTGGAIKNNVFGHGLMLAAGVEADMSGGEISGHVAGPSPNGSPGGHGVEIMSFSTRFTMSGSAVISGNVIGVYSEGNGGTTGNSYPTFTMSGGTISNNTTGVYIKGVYHAFIMRGGTIGSDADTGNTGVVISSGTALILDGTVSIVNNPVKIYTTASSAVAGIYVTGSFNAGTAIKIDLCSTTQTNFNGSWKTGRAVVKGGTSTVSPFSAITQDQLNKFTLNKAYIDDIGEQSGTLTLTLSGDPPLGVAQWTNP
jgi:hypothetical protein